MDIAELLTFAVKNKASDLHLSAGLPPMIRVHGDVRRINLPPMEHQDVHGMIYDIMNDSQRKEYEENLECDFSFAIPGLANLWLIATKDTALLAVVGFNELTQETRQAASSTRAYFTFFLAAGVLYLMVSLASGRIFGRIEKWARKGQPSLRKAGA